MSIYTSTQVHPYVYRCTHKMTGEFYIGFRKANYYPSDQDLPRYKTSSKLVKPRFDEFDWQIIAEFFDPKEALKFEQELIAEHWTNPLILNKVYNINGEFSFFSKRAWNKGKPMSEETKTKIKKKMAGRTQTPEHNERIRQSMLGREILPEWREKLRNANLGKKQSPETIAKKIASATGKKYKSRINPSQYS